MMKFLQKSYMFIIFALLYAPIVVLIVFSFNDGGSLSEFTGISFKWYGELFQDEEVEMVFDATHPYAMNISKNIKKVCKEENIEYVRVLREAIEIEDAVKCFSMDELISYLNETEGIIFSSMGAKEAQSLTGVDNFQERVYLRMLPSPEGMRSCLDLGYPMKNLCGMQGPFSKEFNIAQFKEIGADILVTKESGNAGGFLEKTDAARECGMKIVVLARVEEEGLSIEEAQDILRSRCL